MKNFRSYIWLPYKSKFQKDLDLIELSKGSAKGKSDQSFREAATKGVL